MRKCTKSGVAWLTASDVGVYQDRVYAMPTTCKTKGCVVCRHKVVAKFRMLVEYGCLTLGRSFFMTLTLRMGQGLEKDAVYVRQVWRKFLVYLNSTFPTVEFVKVVELTKQSQPHLHVVLHLGTTFSGSPACEKKAKYNERWLNKQCECLEHLFSSVWSDITGGSFVVDVKEVWSGRSAGSYLGKYMAKSVAYSDRLRKLGFGRVWARSRGWPFDQIQMEQTERGWKKREFTYGRSEMPSGAIGTGSVEWWLNDTKMRGVRRTGTDLAIALQQEREKKAGQRLDPHLLRRLI